MIQFLKAAERMFDGLSEGSVIGKAAIAVGSFITAFYSPIVALLISCFLFTIADMVYGIKVAIKQKSKLTSEKNWKGTISKIIDEFSIISLARLLEYAVIGNTAPFILTGGVTVIVCLTEMWSILENLNTLDPTGPWRALGKFLKKKGEDYIGTEIELKDGNDSVDDNAS